MAPHFPTVTQKDLRDSRGEKSCSICCVDYADGHIPVRTPCNHIFGQNCLAAWLVDHDTCPMCRTDIAGRRRAPERSSRRDEPPSRSRAGTDAPRAPERSARPQLSRVEALRHGPSARPRAGTEAPRTTGAAPRLSVSSSQWDETHMPAGSAHRHPAREAPSRSSHRDSPPPVRQQVPPNHPRTAREAPSSRATHRSRHASRAAEANPMAQLVTLLRSSLREPGANDERVNRSRQRDYPAFTRARLVEVLAPGYIDRASHDEVAHITRQLHASDAREARGENPFEPSGRDRQAASHGHSRRDAESRHADGSRHSGRDAESRHADGSRYSGRDAESRHADGSRRSGSRRDVRNMTDDELADAIGRLML